MTTIAHNNETEHQPDPGRGCRDHLDDSRHEVVRQLCGEKGLALFSFLLASSTADPGQETRAIFSLQRLHDVAVQLGWSPDTVKRYVAVFRAVNLVQHYHESRREIQVHIPLGPYMGLTNFTALDELIGKRKKQQQLALKVKTRYILRFGDPTQAHSQEMRTKLHELTEILDTEHLEPLKRQRLQMRIADLLTHVAKQSLVGDSNHQSGDRLTGMERPGSGPSCSEGDSNEIRDISRSLSRAASENEPGHQGDSNQGTGDFHRQRNISSPWGDSIRTAPFTQARKLQQRGDPNPNEGDSIAQGNISSPWGDGHMGDSNPQQGDSIRTAPFTQARKLQQKGDPNPNEGDSIAQRNSHVGDSNPQQGDSIHPSSSPHMPQVSQQGDSNRRQGDPFPSSQAQQPLKVDPMGDSKQTSQLEKGDSNGQVVAKVDVNAPYTYNVSSLITNIKENYVIRRHIAEFMASVLEKNEFENGYPTFSKYLKAFKVYTPEVIGRAFLATLFLVHRKNWQTNPGATFTNQCKILSGQKPLVCYTLDDVETWLRTWGNLPYPELIVALATPFCAGPSPEPASLLTTPRLPSRADGNIVSAVEKTGMHEDEAEMLAEEILRDAEPYGVTKAVAKQVPGGYVVALIWRGGPMNMKTPEQWRTHFAKVRPHFHKMWQEEKEKSHGTSK